MKKTKEVLIHNLGLLYGISYAKKLTPEAADLIRTIVSGTQEELENMIDKESVLNAHYLKPIEDFINISTLRLMGLTEDELEEYKERRRKETDE